MGLDVYLEKCENLEQETAKEQEYEEKSDGIWGEYSDDYQQMTDVQKEKARQRCDELAEQMGLGSYGTSKEKVKVEIDSTQYPDHYFKIGYFRSSYNSGGINNVFRRLGIPDLYDIFEPNDGYEFTPDWEKAKQQAQNVLSILDEKMKKPLYDATEVSIFDFDGPTSEQEAIARYLEKTEECSLDAFSCRDGLFYKQDGLQVVGVMFGENIIKRPCVYLITKQEQNHYDWYRKAIEIVIETIDYVLSQDDSQNYYLCWSS